LLITTLTFVVIIAGNTNLVATLLFTSICCQSNILRTLDVSVTFDVGVEVDGVVVGVEIKVGVSVAFSLPVMLTQTEIQGKVLNK
jgi:hypothetical protein